MNADEVIVWCESSNTVLVERLSGLSQDAYPLVGVFGEPSAPDEAAAPLAPSNTSGWATDDTGFAGNDGSKCR